MKTNQESRKAGMPAFFHCTFSAELAYREMRINAAAFAPIIRAAHFGHAIAVARMPVLVFNIYFCGRRTTAWIGLN